MSGLGNTTISLGEKNIEEIVTKFCQRTSGAAMNEADTRFQIIDNIIIDCLGWPRNEKEFKLETVYNRKYTDYELGSPKKVIWEAKREGKVFDLPADANNKLLCDLQSIIKLCPLAKEAIEQAQGYCNSRGVEIAVVTNGHQYIAFLAHRNDGIPPLEGKCLRVNSLQHFQDNFPNIWQFLSPDGIAQNKLKKFLQEDDIKYIPEKLSSKLPKYPNIKERNTFQNSLYTLGELLLIDATEQEGEETRFYEECYCESTTLSQHAFVSKKLLESRYQALFSHERDFNPEVIPATQINKKNRKKTEIPIDDMRSEAASLRPIVLLGDVGVGKTSFIKNLIYVKGKEEFQNYAFIYIDLGSTGALEESLSNFVVSQIYDQLDDKYNINIEEQKFVKGVYSREIQKFSTGIHAELKDTNKSLYDQKKIEMLGEKLANKAEHLKKSLKHIQREYKKLLIVSLDNADQRPLEIQQQGFVISQNLAKDYNLMVFISVRPQTFYVSKQKGVLSAYPNRVFTVSPPCIENVIRKRLLYASKIAEGTIQSKALRQIKLDLSNIVLIIKSILKSMEKNDEIKEFLSNITGGNIRQAIDLVAELIGSPNLDTKHIVDIMEGGRNYLLPIHEFWKIALKGDALYFSSEKSFAINLFDVFSTDRKEHFLMSMILNYVLSKQELYKNDDFIKIDEIIEEMQNNGFLLESINKSIKLLVQKKAFDTPQRDNSANEFAECRITSLGVYHTSKWLANFSYLDTVLFDTPIFKKEYKEKINLNLSSHKLDDRFNRSLSFRDYLNNIWNEDNIKVSYFDWNMQVDKENESFEKVHKKILQRIDASNT